MHQKQRRHSIDSLFTFLLLIAFTMFTLLLAGMGAVVYKNSAAHLNENYTSRTAVAYAAEKIRQHDRAGRIELSEVEEIPALALHSEVGGEAFVTYIYFYEQALRELFIREEYAPSAELGSPLVELSAFTAEQLEDGLYQVSAVSMEGNEMSMVIHSRTAKSSE